jgi:ribonuclease BN (tRNA processing enzyme)
MYPGLFSREMSFVIEYVEIRAGEPTDVAGAVVTAYAARHSAGESPAHSLRVGIAGKTVAYSGDTGWSETLVEVAAGADLFICEASHYDEDTEGHLSYQTLVRRRADFDSKRMILTHMGDEVLDRLESLEIETASDGMRINL